MPLYEYYCSTCQSKFELLVSHRHADEIVCMKCHSEKVRRLLSVFSHLGGSDTSLENISAADSGCSCGGACGCH